MNNILENKFWWAARSFVAVLALGTYTSNLSAEDTLFVAHSTEPNDWISAIENDRLEDGSQAHDVYMLEADKVYRQSVTLNLESSCKIIGAPYGDGQHPATIQPIGDYDGNSEFSGWPTTNIKTYGEDQSYEFKNLLFNGVFYHGEHRLFGVLATYGARNFILVDNVTSVHNEVITYFNFGHEEHWVLTNNTAVQYTSYPSGMFFGGFWWGGGSWTGTVESLFIQNNTIEGTHGEPLVIYDNGLVNRDGNEMIHIDHNTFVNSTLEAMFGRHGNNTNWTNNLFVNLQSGGQTTNAWETNLAVNQDTENGHGKIMALYQPYCGDSTLVADGNCWDNHNRNIHYNNNAWFDTPELVSEIFSRDPWCWDETIYDDDGYEVETITVCDTMIANQSKWVGDSTIAQFVNGVSESNNINATDLGWNLDPSYIMFQIARTKDWLDNGPGHDNTDRFWMYQADGNPLSVEWPLPMDFSYSETSAAATHCTHGGPLGSTHHMDHDGTLFDPDLDDRVFISEVAEGTSNNKYIEIYNGTGEDVDLSAYSISTCNNGCDNEGEFDYPNNVTFESGTIVANGDVYVVCHGSASDGIQAECDQTFTYLSNGDDLYALTGAGATAGSYVVVDNVGDFGDDPGAGWDVAGIGSATKDHTLIRKGTVTNGNTDWVASAGVDAVSSEWIVSDKPTADYTSATLGSHTMTGPVVFVHFNVYAPDAPDTLWATGSFEGWSGYGVAMTDPDGNGIYNGTVELPENFGDVEYKYTQGGWDVNIGANPGDWCDWNPNDEWNNFGFYVEEHDIHLPIFVWGQGCEQWHSDMSGPPWMIANEPGSMRVGPTMGSGEWWQNDEGSLSERACYFDDRYFFHWNGDFHIDFGGNTWVETWQDDIGDGCRAPVAPHDNSNYATYSFDNDAGTITLHGTGAFIGLPKAFNGGELTTAGTEVPGSRTYIIDQFDEDSAMVYIDISTNEDGTAWWTYTMVREPEPTMVTFWLDANDVPCDGNNPYLAGSFNGWNATDIEMTYDSDYDEYYADVWLMPGYYEYKFTCFNWSNSENIPDECSDPFDDGYNNRYVEVPELDGDDWHEVDVVSWGECPEPDPCDLVDCNNLQIVSVLQKEQIDAIADTLFSYDSYTDVSMESIVSNLYMSIATPQGIYHADYLSVYSEPEDSTLIYIAEVPGIPDSILYYYWQFNWGEQVSDSSEGFGWEWEQLANLDSDSDACLTEYIDPEDGPSGFYVRYWDPAEWEEELYMLSMGEIHPTDIWNVDLYGSCEYWYDFDDVPDNSIYLGNFQGHDYYQINSFSHWEEANEAADAMGGYLVTITSSEENDFLYNNIDWGVSSDMYMGLYDATMDNNGWTWVTGEPFNYQNWDDGQPDCPGCQNYGVIWMNGDGKWDDGDAAFPFIVEFGEPVIPDPPVLTNYFVEVINSNAFYDGDTVGTLPSLDIYDGIHFTATFDTTGAGPYMGFATVFYDANFSGTLDTNDQNVFSSGWADIGSDVYVIFDNGPNDDNPEVGVYEENVWVQDEGNDLLRLQGATFFYAALDTSNTIVNVQAVSPYSSSMQRYSGDAVMAHDSTEGVPGLFFGVWSDGNFSRGVTGPAGHYSIGVEVDEGTGSWLFHDGLQRDNPNWSGRLLPVFWDEDWNNGQWGNYYYTDSLPAEGVYVPTMVVLMNTLVQGQMLDHIGNPIGHEVWMDVRKFVIDDSSSIGVNTGTLTDQDGHYQFWTLNGTENNIEIYYDDHIAYDSLLYVFSDVFDDELDGYVFNHDIQLAPPDPGPPVNLTTNGGFENWIDGWTVYPYDASNWWVDSTGAGIYSSPNNATLEVYEGSHALKMWGGYHSDGTNWTDIYQAHYDRVDVGATIHASTMMMSHPDDWIGTLDSSVHLGTNAVRLFISYWDEYGSWISADWSNPFDGTFAAGEWHHFDVTGVVPEGTYQINIGVSFNQNDWSNGSVYIDDFHSNTGLTFVEAGWIEGHVYGEMYDEDYQYWYMAELPNIPVEVYSEHNYYVTHTDEYGYYSIEVPSGDEYYVVGPDLPGLYTHDMSSVYVHEGNWHLAGEIHYYALANQWFEVTGYVYDSDGYILDNAEIQFHGVSDSSYWDVSYSEWGSGWFSAWMPYGTYDVRISAPGYHVQWIDGLEVHDYIHLGDIYLDLITEFDGAAQGVVSYIGQGSPPPYAYISFTSDAYSIDVETNENGFYYVDLLNGIYDVYADADGYSDIFIEGAFEVSGNTVVFDMELFEYGYAGPPEIVDLHDVPNDQGRQMRTVWHTGEPGDWEYFTQFSIWRKVNGATIDLWDYVETVPWHGEGDPYATVVPTLGDSSMHENHLSTFIVTAHTEDVNYYIDSEPVSGYSVDNLHPGTPMNFMMSQDPGAVSLSWTRYDDEDFDYHNIYRREIASDEPAIVFTTVDSFYVDQDVSETGAYEYWVTSVDMSGLESDPSNSVSAVLSADENIGLPTEFALNQNYPNPFNPSTQIQYALPEEAMVTISIYDLMGRKVRTLVSGVQDAGYRTVMWNATNDMGRLVSAGVYIYSIHAGDFVQNRKMVLMK